MAKILFSLALALVLAGPALAADVSKLQLSGDITLGQAQKVMDRSEEHTSELQSR